MKTGIIDICKQIEDPRMDRKKVHKMETIIYVSIAAVICRIQNAARNFSAVTKMALAILKDDKITKGSMNLKRLKAGWDENYLPTLLKDSAF